jgi:class 3 adenylate cyclase
MSLRYRLFVWISTLFLLAGVSTYMLEMFSTQKELENTRIQLKEKFRAVSEKKRQNFQNFLASNLGENQARIDILLARLSSYPLQAAAFAPTQNNYVKGTWLAASEVLNNNRWFNFIQNTNQGQLASLVIPRFDSLDRSLRIEINDDLAWILMNDMENEEPHLGIRLRFNAGDEARRHITSNEVVETTGQIPKAYLLFSWRQLLCPSEKGANAPIFKGVIPPIQANLSAPWTDGASLNVERFFAAFQTAREYVSQGLGTVSENETDRVRAWMEKEFKSLGQDLNFTAVPKEIPQNLPTPFFKRELADLATRNDQLYLIWCLAVMNDLDIFGGDLFSSSAPLGIAVHFGKNQVGEGLHTTDVFYSKAGFDDESYFKQHAGFGGSSNLSSRIAVFQPFALDHVFLGNTAQYRVKEGDVTRLGYLTVGTDADAILEQLVLATHQTSLLVTGGKLIGGFSGEGKKIRLEESDPLPVSQMLKDQLGTVQWCNEKYYYTLMTPFEHLDIHFVLLNPVAKEFALLNNLEQSAEVIIKGILFNIHIIGISILVLAILILHYLSRKITLPISKLAKATCEIAEGHLEQVEIPVPSAKDTDEVASLCRSFEQMVKGLREKEKVKAVLNKVVSQEIAQEILKGNIQLGGEEKKVSILFADIRDFTAMTQEMSPQEVIDLLNVCMTKISHFVDQHGGVIDKYVGDEAMALFGAPVECRDSAYKAILSALGMIEAIKKWNEQRKKLELPPVEIGIGIHTGTVLAGNMGAENRLNYTVLGSNVNLASRLCSVAEGMEILISESALKEPQVMEKILYEEIPPMTLKGFDVPIVVYRVRGFK